MPNPSFGATPNAAGPASTRTLGVTEMTSQVVYQRIRNRIIEMLERIIESEKKAPTLGFDELINSWEDWVSSPPQKDEFPVPVYTAAESDRLREVSLAVDALCKATPTSITDDVGALVLPEWTVVVETARNTHAELMMRGRLSEEEGVRL